MISSNPYLDQSMRYGIGYGVSKIPYVGSYIGPAYNIFSAHGLKQTPELSRLGVSVPSELSTRAARQQAAITGALAFVPTAGPILSFAANRYFGGKKKKAAKELQEQVSQKVSKLQQEAAISQRQRTAWDKQRQATIKTLIDKALTPRKQPQPMSPQEMLWRRQFLGSGLGGNEYGY